MAALFLTTLLALIGVTVAGVLADSGLRWWSAFGRLRRDLARERVMGAATMLPVPRVSVSYACFNRPPVRNQGSRNRINRAAA